MATLPGLPGDDFIVGTSFNDLILGEEGNDVLIGESENDTIIGGLGNDLINTGTGNDFADGGEGDDNLVGEEGDDVLVGANGNDSLQGGVGSDFLEGGFGNDFLFGGAGRDFLTGGAGSDTFVINNGTGGAVIRNADVINDFVDGQDLILMADGLRFGQLNIFQGTGLRARDTIIQNRLTGEFLAVLRGVNRQRIGRRDFLLGNTPQRDLAPPQVGSFFAGNITSPGNANQFFSVQFADAVQLDSRSFRNSNILVVGPNGYQQFATFVGANVPGNGTSRTVGYTANAPAGTWHANDNGVYQVLLLQGQIFDTSGNPVPFTNLGSFTVDVPIPVVPVAVAVESLPVVEDSDNAMVFTFTRSEFIRNSLTVSFNLAGSATFSDYTIAGATVNNGVGTVTFAPGAATATVRLTPTRDTIRETDETVVVSLVPGPAYRPASIEPATGVIADDESDIALKIEPASVFEDGTTAMVYTFTRSGFNNREITVNFAVSGNASLGSDYTATAASGTTFTFTATEGRVTFEPGVTTRSIRLVSVADTTFEPNETVSLQLTNGMGYVPTTSEAVIGTILNDEGAIAISVMPTASLEDSGAALVYTFSRTGFAGNPATVNFTLGGTASPNDYLLSGATISGTVGTVNFAADATTATVTVTPTSDTTLEEDETLSLSLTPGTGYVLGDQTTAIGTIRNDESSVSLTVQPESVMENSGNALVYTFTRSGFIDRAITVGFDVGGSALAVGANSDYVVAEGTGTVATFSGNSGTVSFAERETTKTLRFTPNPDANREGDETVSLRLRAGNGYVPVTAEAVTSTIVDDDVAVSLTVNTTSVEEDTGTIVYTFSRAGFLSNPLTVRFSVGGTAIASSDYTASSDAAGLDFAAGTLTFAAGQDTVRVTLTPNRDETIIEQNETVTLQLLSDAAYSIGTSGPVTTTIQNDDGIVRNISDSGAGSLRQAIAAALDPLSTDRTVRFSPTTVGTINLASALPVLSRNIAIVGPGSANLEVRRNSSDNFRIFEVARGAEVSIQGVAIANGQGVPVPGDTIPVGGGVLNEGRLTLSDTLITGNRADRGAGIHNSGDLTLRDRNRITNNTASNLGGGIYNNISSTLTITASDSSPANLNIISGNSALSFTGGGIYNDGTATVRFTDFFANSATSGVPRSGGAIYNAVSPSQVAVGNSFFNRTPLNLPNAIGGAMGVGTAAITDLGQNVFA